MYIKNTMVNKMSTSYAEDLITRDIIRNDDVDNLSRDDFMVALRFAAFDGLTEKSNPACRDILLQAVKRSVDDPEISVVLSDALFGSKTSKQLSTEFKLLSGDEQDDIKKSFFLTNLGLKPVGEDNVAIINTDYIIAAVKNTDFTDESYNFENIMAAVNIVNGMDENSQTMKNLSDSDKRDFISFGKVYNIIEDQETMDRIKEIEAEYKERIEADLLKIENKSSIERYRRELTEISNQDGGSISPVSIPDRVPDREEYNRRKQKEIDIELVDWQKRYSDYLNKNSDNLKIMSFGAKNLEKLRGDNGFSPRFASFFGDSIVATDKYGDAQDAIWNLSPITQTMKIGKHFDYSNPEKTQQAFTIAALKARKEGWSEIHLGHPGPDAQAKMFLENTIKAMIEVGEYDLDQINVPKKYQHVLESFREDRGIVSNIKLDGESITADELDISSIKDKLDSQKEVKENVEESRLGPLNSEKFNTPDESVDIAKLGSGIAESISIINPNSALAGVSPLTPSKVNYVLEPEPTLEPALEPALAPEIETNASYLNPVGGDEVAPVQDPNNTPPPFEDEGRYYDDEPDLDPSFYGIEPSLQEDEATLGQENPDQGFFDFVKKMNLENPERSGLSPDQLKAEYEISILETPNPKLLEEIMEIHDKQVKTALSSDALVSSYAGMSSIDTPTTESNETPDPSEKSKRKSRNSRNSRP